MKQLFLIATCLLGLLTSTAIAQNQKLPAKITARQKVLSVNPPTKALTYELTFSIRKFTPEQIQAIRDGLSKHASAKHKSVVIYQLTEQGALVYDQISATQEGHVAGSPQEVAKAVVEALFPQATVKTTQNRDTFVMELSPKPAAAATATGQSPTKVNPD